MAADKPGSALFNLELSSDGTSLSIRINGPKLDVTCAPELKALVEKIWRPSVIHVTIDFSTVEFMDSFGIGSLFGIYKRLPQNVPPAVILNPSPSVVTIIQLVRLDRVFLLKRT